MRQRVNKEGRRASQNRKLNWCLCKVLGKKRQLACGTGGLGGRGRHGKDGTRAIRPALRLSHASAQTVRWVWKGFEMYAAPAATVRSVQIWCVWDVDGWFCHWSLRKMRRPGARYLIEKSVCVHGWVLGICFSCGEWMYKCIFNESKVIDTCTTAVHHTWAGRVKGKSTFSMGFILKTSFIVFSN